MGLFDGLGEKIAENSGKIKDGIEKGGDFIDEKTGGKFKEQVDKGQSFASEQVDRLGKKDGREG